ncbi:MAG: hypothetical protein E6K19_04625 [Methanobacteriota archaeon]|nr:MAG: hypothetical protein E6K19_04625 [Euryarchaeota archaeon]
MDEVAYRSPRTLWHLTRKSVYRAGFVAGLVVALVVFRLLWDRFLDPFEDGYQNWWTASALLETGTYSNRFSLMTQGNWLPGYTFFATGLIAVAGTHIMPLMKAANILFSLETTGLIYGLVRPRGRIAAGLAAALFALSPADIVISSFATPEALALLATFAGVVVLERRPVAQRKPIMIAALAFLVGSTLRYEVWGFVAAYLLLSWRAKRIDRRELLSLAAPASIFAAIWWLWTSQYGFLPAMIIAQTSADVQYKASVGTLAPLTDRLFTFFAWYLGWTPFAVLGIAWGLLKHRKSPLTWILCMFYGAEIVYTAAGFGNPGPRYIHLTLPIVCANSGMAIATIGTWRPRAAQFLRRAQTWGPVLAAVTLSIVLAVQISSVSPPPGFFLSGTQRAGEFLSTLDLPDGKVLISESPIATYYSGYPSSRVLAPSGLPQDAVDATAFIIANAAYVVMVTVPYNRIRQLFPDQANGVNGHHFILLYDATGVEYNFGAPRVLVFRIVP